MHEIEEAYHTVSSSTQFLDPQEGRDFVEIEGRVFEVVNLGEGRRKMGFGYTVQVYGFEKNTSADLLRITIQPGSSTPPEELVTDKTFVDYPIEGRGKVI